MAYSTFRLKVPQCKEINMRTVKRCVAQLTGFISSLQAGWKPANKLDAAKCVRSWSGKRGLLFQAVRQKAAAAATGSRSKVRFVRQNIIYVPPGGRECAEINSERRVISLQGNLIFFFVCAEPPANCFHISIHTHESDWFMAVLYINRRKWKCAPQARIKTNFGDCWRTQQVTYIWLGGAGVIYLRPQLRTASWRRHALLKPLISSRGLGRKHVLWIMI